MQFLNFIREDPVMGWFAVLAALLVVVPLLPWVWNRMTGRRPAVKKAVAVTHTKVLRFDSRTDLLLIFLGVAVLLFVFFLVRSAWS